MPMNIQQITYIIAVEKYRHFQKAADACFVTQATLSMMVKKLEEELGVSLFDRSRQPITPTEIGVQIVEQAKKAFFEINHLQQIAYDSQKTLKGTLRIGIIPTLAPYLLPLFLYDFLKKYPDIQLIITEINTQQIGEKLRNDDLDIGIMATPLADANGLETTFLFQEKLLAFVSKEEKMMQKQYILPSDIDVQRLWLLHEGHCLRSQILALCELRAMQSDNRNLAYEAGSIESLLKIVEQHNGITIVPELAVLDFSNERKTQIRTFADPIPTREISLVTYRHFVKHRLLQLLREEIQEAVKGYL